MINIMDIIINDKIYKLGFLKENTSNIVLLDISTGINYEQSIDEKKVDHHELDFDEFYKLLKYDNHMQITGKKISNVITLKIKIMSLILPEYSSKYYIKFYKKSKYCYGDDDYDLGNLIV